MVKYEGCSRIFYKTLAYQHNVFTIQFDDIFNGQVLNNLKKKLM